MKMDYTHVGLARLCAWFGVTRQAYYQHFWSMTDHVIEQDLIVQEVLQIRKNHRWMGGRKLYEKLYPFMLEHQIKMGRDAFFDLLSYHGLLIRRRKRRIVTTNSSHWLRKYPNLIRDFVPTAPNQLWVSDITYWKINNKDVYINLITDAYSRYIVGYHGAPTLEAIESIKALKMALKTTKNNQPESLIHHSDRGVQYCSSDYVKLLQDNGIEISMTENGDPLENAIAERINGIIKNEYLIDYSVDNIGNAQQLLKKAVELYNYDRPHMSIGNLTPAHVYYSKTTLKTERLWKNYYNKRNNFVNEYQDLDIHVNLLQD
jgi:transposase InsO family protein